MSTERIALLVVSSLLAVVTGALAWVLWRDSGLELRNIEAHPIAEALQAETEAAEGVWPPVAGGLAPALVAGRDAGQARDAG
ncbi:MAG: hypothetical protein K1X94_23555, partial [Sandaracinaceae bacterium]|nr:hypothetical protein [Sandaracinaceae bacterium]